MAEVYVSVGSNIDPADNVRSGVESLRQQFEQLELSRVFESRAVGFDGENFYNLVVRFQTDRAVLEVVDLLQQMELRHGRSRASEKFSARTLDLDLLLYDDLVYNHHGVRLPRPEIEVYAFVLKPLSELAGSWIHPLTHKSLEQMWQESDMGDQELWPLDLSC